MRRLVVLLAVAVTAAANAGTAFADILCDWDSGSVCCYGSRQLMFTNTFKSDWSTGSYFYSGRKRWDGSFAYYSWQWKSDQYINTVDVYRSTWMQMDVSGTWSWQMEQYADPGPC